MNRKLSVSQSFFFLRTNKSICMDAGGIPVFPNANQQQQVHQQQLHLQQQQQQQQHLQQQQQHNQQLNQFQQQQNIVQGLNQLCQQQQQQQQRPQETPKHQAVVDRLRRRIETYRRRQSDCVPRFDQTFNGVYEQSNLETNVLKKRVLESKTKRAPKKQEKNKQTDTTLAGNLQSSVHVVS